MLVCPTCDQPPSAANASVSLRAGGRARAAGQPRFHPRVTGAFTGNAACRRVPQSGLARVPPTGRLQHTVSRALHTRSTGTSHSYTGTGPLPTSPAARGPCRCRRIALTPSRPCRGTVEPRSRQPPTPGRRTQPREAGCGVTRDFGPHCFAFCPLWKSSNCSPELKGQITAS